MATENNMTENNNSAAPSPGLSWRNLGIIISALATVVLIALGYVGFYYLLNLNSNIAKMTSGLSNQVTQNQADIVSLQKSVDNSQQALTEQLTKQQQLLNELSSNKQNTKDEWTVAEAQYLVKLANDNLQVGDNIPLVINLLQTADQEIRDLSDAKLDPLRKALASDIAALQAVPRVDRTGIYMKLSALNEQVDKLPLPNKRPASEQEQSTTADSAQLSWWKRGWQKSLSVLQKMVIVRYNAPGVRPFILPEQQDFLYQNIHAQFAQAMSAVVHRQPEIYRNSLQQAESWIKQYFLLDSPVTETQIKTLTDLQAVTLSPTLPNISASLQAFRDYDAQAAQAAQTSAT